MGFNSLLIIFPMGVVIIEIPEDIEIKIKAKNLEEAVKILQEKAEEQKKILQALDFLKKYGGKLSLENGENGI
ncbi:MAG: hypothetical protein DSZ31_01650 [Gammaproteobacteria bacterium]|nr:MAG: hypothetical protein DSZ31_01650 [Gammaproteobacteria bacterium]